MSTHKTTEACQEVSLQCLTWVRQWRTCGRGCDHAIAYCDAHGGDARAAQEMTGHHATHDERG